MGMDHEPLDTDTIEKNLVYVSTEKLEQLGLQQSRGGGSASFSGMGMGIQVRPKSQRELLNAAANLFASQGLLVYEEEPPLHSWLVVRMVGACGSAWPWAGNRPEFHETAWWIGKSEKLRILAYGHRDHLVGVGKTPAPVAGSKATWWPSMMGAYGDLLASIGDAVSSDNPDDTPEFPSGSSGLGGLDRYLFIDSVRRGDYLIEPGVFEMLLRVHGIDRDPDEVPRVYGSPLWVARVTEPVSGTYLVADFPEEPGVSAVGSWDGRAWSDVRIEDHRDHILRARVPTVDPPETPTIPPDVSRILSLSIRSEPSDERASEEVFSGRESRRGILARLRGLLAR